MLQALVAFRGLREHCSRSVFASSHASESLAQHVMGDGGGKEIAGVGMTEGTPLCLDHDGAPSSPARAETDPRPL